MNKERMLIDYVNNFYNNLGYELNNEQKMIFETGVAQGIIFALTNLIDINIDLKILGQYQPENIDKIKE